MKMQVYLSNLGKYDEGQLAGPWFIPSIDPEDVKEKIFVFIYFPVLLLLFFKLNLFLYYVTFTVYHVDHIDFIALTLPLRQGVR
jgi:hypothetical protein